MRMLNRCRNTRTGWALLAQAFKGLARAMTFDLCMILATSNRLRKDKTLQGTSQFQLRAHLSRFGEGPACFTSSTSPSISDWARLSTIANLSRLYLVPTTITCHGHPQMGRKTGTTSACPARNRLPSSSNSFDLGGSSNTEASKKAALANNGNNSNNRNNNNTKILILILIQYEYTNTNNNNNGA